MRNVLSDEEFGKRSRARSAAQRALARGDIILEPCVECGRENAEMHHPDHQRPLAVVWLCRRCHSDEHVVERRVATIRLNGYLRGAIRRLKAAKRKRAASPQDDLFGGANAA